MTKLATLFVRFQARSSGSGPAIESNGRSIRARRPRRADRHGQGGSLLRAAGICRSRSTDRPARTRRLSVDVRRQGQFDEPSELLLADKAEFGTSRIRRWFDRDWTSYRTHSRASYN
jgi:hypothetical protein